MGSPRPFTSLVPALGLEYVGIPGLPSQGKVFFVKPYSGSDSSSGRRPDRAMKTLKGALAKCTAGHNDVVYLMAESNTAAYTTDYLTTYLDWNKDAVHLIGVNAGAAMGQRSRVAWASTTSTSTATELFRVSANNCLIANIEFYQGLASATSMLGCMKVTGMRNKFYNCQIAGIGHVDNDISGAYSLYLYGAQENIFERCTIGLDTVTRTTATASEILVDNMSPRNEFYNCKIISFLGSSTQHPQIYVGSNTGVDRWLLFTYCQFINSSLNATYPQTYVIAEAAALASGSILIHHCAAFGATNFSAASKNVQLVNSPINTAYTGGTGYKA